MLALLTILAAQVTPVQPIAKGTGLPPQRGEEAAVMAPVNALLAAIGAGDPAAALAQARTEGGLTVARENPDGTRAVQRMSWGDFAGRLKPGAGVEERLLDPAVEVDGDIAMVWSPYVLTVGGRTHHCGTDHFDLVREGGVWKVLNITWSQRTSGCPA